MLHELFAESALALRRQLRSADDKLAARAAADMARLWCNVYRHRLKPRGKGDKGIDRAEGIDDTHLRYARVMNALTPEQRRHFEERSVADWLRQNPDWRPPDDPGDGPTSFGGGGGGPPDEPLPAGSGGAARSASEDVSRPRQITDLAGASGYEPDDGPTARLRRRCPSARRPARLCPRRRRLYNALPPSRPRPVAGAAGMLDRIASQGITFDDVLLEPGYSEVVPRDVDVQTQLTPNVRLNIPLVSSPMDTVTESELAIALAQEGGIGIIHKNLTAADQAREVEKVKRSENGIIVDPVTLSPDATVAEAREMMASHHVSGIPITVGPEKQLRGILTRRDLRFLTDNSQKIADVMTRENLITAPEDTSLAAAEQLLTKNKVEKLLLVDDLYRLKGLITIKDIDKTQNFPQACKDARGRLRVGAAVGVHDYERADALIRAGVDLLTVDSAHGHSKNVVETVRELKRRYRIDVVAGNVATAEGAVALADAGADAVKVGIGPGSICTTRIVSGVGVPQMTAIANAVRGLTGRNVPVIADGGVRYSGDVTKALAGGANAVMIGGLFAGLAESPGETILYRGRTFKSYRGMGSLGAMVAGAKAGTPDRYGQTEGRKAVAGKLVPEGVEGRVPYKGPLAPFVFQLVGGVRAGMGYVGAATLDELRTKARFIQVSGASVQEGHPHDIAITQESPNYSVVGPGRSDAD